MIVALIALVGVLFSVFANHRLQLWREKNAARIAAGTNLRAAFAPALAFLDKARRHGSTHETPDANAFLREAFVNHAAAIEDFRPFVRAKDLEAYQQAWETHCEIAHGPRDSDAVFMATTIDDNDPWQVLQDQIHAILQFAKT